MLTWLIVWVIVEAVQYARKKPFPERMTAPALWFVACATLSSIGYSSAGDRTSIVFFSSLALNGFVALMIYGFRRVVAALWGSWFSKSKTETIATDHVQQPELSKFAIKSEKLHFGKKDFPIFEAQPLNATDGLAQEILSPDINNFDLEQGDSGISEDCWSKALAEFEGTTRRLGVWAKVFSESGGSEMAAKAKYLSIRANEIYTEAVANNLVEKQRHGAEVESKRAIALYANLLDGKCNDSESITACEAYLNVLGFNVKRARSDQWEISGNGCTTFVYSVEDLRKQTSKLERRFKEVSANSALNLETYV